MNTNIEIPSLIDMGLILGSMSDLKRAYEQLKIGGFQRFILLHTGEIDDEMLAHPSYLKNKFPGIIPAFHPLKNGKFHNFELLHTDDATSHKLIFYSHTAHKSLHIAETYQSMLKAHDYDALYISFPHNKRLAADGVIHQGDMSFQMGLPGLSHLSESAVISRDLELAHDIGVQLHFHQISSKRSVHLIRQAKKEGTNVTCGVSAGHLLYTHTNTSGFNKDFKFIPPLREESDRLALIEGVQDGTIDTISTGHYNDNKSSINYLRAPITSMRPEIIFKELHSNLVEKQIIEFQTLINLLAINPRKILGIPMEATHHQDNTCE